jgi:hypothetical protein
MTHVVLDRRLHRLEPSERRRKLRSDAFHWQALPLELNQSNIDLAAIQVKQDEVTALCPRLGSIIEEMEQWLLIAIIILAIKLYGE